MLDTLVLVRHGQSEHNLLYNLQVQGRPIPPEYEEIRQRPNTDFLLTRLGRFQAVQAGRWIRENLQMSFTRKYVADLARTKETAALLDIDQDGVQWWLEPNLREQAFGLLDEILPLEVRKEGERIYREYLNHHDKNDFFTQPPVGESRIQHMIRASLVYETMHWGVPGESAIMVTSEGTIWALRIRIERLTQERFKRLITSRKPHHQIHNGQVIIYTVINPRTGVRTESFSWMKSICPEHPDFSYNGGKWCRIKRPNFTREQLLASVEHIPLIIKD